MVELMAALTVLGAMRLDVRLIFNMMTEIFVILCTGEEGGGGGVVIRICCK